jgi:hypothetical protein
MSAELGQTNDPRALVPGDPAAVAENARVLRERARDVLAAGDALKRIDTGAWTGPAASKWHEDNQTEVPRWLQGGDSLDSAAQALTDYANCLTWAQGQATEAIHLWQSGETATRNAQAAHDKAVVDAQAQTQANAGRGDPTVVAAPPFADPGEAPRQTARDMLDRARQQLREAGDRGAEALRTEAQLAPQDSQKQADANFFGGLWDSISGAGESLLNLISDPGSTVAAMADAATHPVQTVKDMVAWDDWVSGRGDRALGKVTGDMLVAIATAGVGKAAKLGREHPRHHDGPSTVGDGVPKAPEVAKEAIDYATRPPKLDHVFVPKHKLEPLLDRFGGREGAMHEIVNSLGDTTGLPESGAFEVVREIAGQPVHIRGAVVNGVPKIGTVFTP